MSIVFLGNYPYSKYSKLKLDDFDPIKIKFLYISVHHYLRIQRVFQFFNSHVYWE